MAGLREAWFSAGSILLFIAFVIAIVVMQLDDAFVVLRHPIELPDAYWPIARCLYSSLR